MNIKIKLIFPDFFLYKYFWNGYFKYSEAGNCVVFMLLINVDIADVDKTVGRTVSYLAIHLGSKCVR